MSEMPAAIASRVQAAVRDAIGGRRRAGSPSMPSMTSSSGALTKSCRPLGQEPQDTPFLLWPSAVRLMLATFLEDVVQQDEGRVL